MKIVHIANFYGPKSGGIRTTLHELGKGIKLADMSSLTLCLKMDSL
jgi:hypothetical protein